LYTTENVFDDVPLSAHRLPLSVEMPNLLPEVVCVPFKPLPDLSNTAEILLLPSRVTVAASAKSTHRASPAICRGLNPLASGRKSLGFIGMGGASVEW
jgi:hypothetical protein